MAEPRPHSPSQARAIIQEAKSGHGRALAILAEEARAIADPSYAAEALMALSLDSRLPAGVAAPLLEEIIALVAKIDREWRRAEALTDLVKKGSKWRTNGGAGAAIAREKFLNETIRLVSDFEPGQARSQAIQGLAPHLDPATPLLPLALANRGFEFEDAKAVLKGAAVGPEARALLEQVVDPAVRARLLAFAHQNDPRAGLLGWAVGSVRGLPEAERLEVLRGMVAAAREPAELQALRAEAEAMDPEGAARLLAALGARADRMAMGKVALEWFREGVAKCTLIAEAKPRASVRNNLAEGLARAGAVEEANALRVLVQGDRESARPEGMEPVKSAPTIASLPATPPKQSKKEAKRSGIRDAPSRHVLALYDTYEGGLKEVHMRAIARAAPLCYAFDLDLALMGFPAEDLQRLLRAVSSETNIGEGGRYLDELAKAKRVHLVPCTTKEPPTDWSEVGLPVATTPEPDPMKSVDFPPALIAARKAGYDKLCLIMGLGKRGLPDSLLRGVRHHLELTGRKVSMETATAMGVIAERLRNTPPV